jgi:hypothetical protein
MPKASPTHVIVHRLELQKGLNQELVQYLDAQQKQTEFNTLLKTGTTVAAVYAGYVGLTFAARLWSATSLSLGGLFDDAKETVDEVIESYVTGSEGTKVSDITGEEWAGGDGVSEPVVPNPLYGVPILGPIYSWNQKAKKRREPAAMKAARWWQRNVMDR